MKRFFSAVALCLFLLIAGLFIFLPYTRAETDPIISLLNLPAPPPPNPLINPRKNYEGRETGDKMNPPKDDAPIDELLNYWNGQNSSYQSLRYSPKPSEKTVERLMAEIEKKPELIDGYLNILPDTPEIVEKVKQYYDAGIPQPKDSEAEDYSPNAAVKTWLTNHSKYFINDLIKTARQVREDREYVTNQDDLLALVHVDWDSARPIVERLYGDSSQPVSQTLARWAFYRHAVETNDSSDTDKYRDELKSAVENKSAGGGLRDLAMDALVSEGDWNGRDDWYFSLLKDETLYDLRVNGQSYTGLTTLMLKSPPDKYKDKMIELVKSGSPGVRGAAIRNLSPLVSAKNPEIVEALLPWLENPKWANDTGGARARLIEALGTLQMPESVPGLIAVLNEKKKTSTAYSNRMLANVAVNRPMGNYNGAVDADEVNSYVYLGPVITALGTQKDIRAVAPIRQILPQLEEYERGTAVKALLACGGFSTAEQVDALEAVAKDADKFESVRKESEAAMAAANAAGKQDADEDTETDSDDDTSIASPVTRAESITSIGEAPYSMANTAGNYYENSYRNQPLTADYLQKLLGQTLIADSEPDEQLVGETINRIGVLEKKDPLAANGLRTILRNWKGAAVNAFLLRDLKNGKTDDESIVKLLSQRKILREKQPNEVYDIRGGTPTALGISACLIENDGEYDAILNNDNAAAKTAMLACARLIRARLPIQKVAENLKSGDKMLALAAEKYLESEDSSEARSIVLSLHPNEAKIMGATYYFSDNDSHGENAFLDPLYASIGSDEENAPSYYGYDSSEELRKTEKRLKKELKEDQNLFGVYAFDKNFVRIFKDKAVFSWEEDDSRYHERPLEVNEFEYLKNYLASQNADSLPPFISGCEDCEDKELLMIGKNGGRRVFLKAGEQPEFFAGLEKIFTDLRQTPARLRYKLEKDVAGLEILLANDNLKAESVWKNGSDLRLLINDEKQHEQIDKEIKNQERTEEESEDFDYEKAEPMRRKRREQRAYENYSWQQFDKNQLVGIVSQPPQVEYIPPRDSSPVTAQQGQWKRRAGNVEVREDGEAIYKIARGQLTKIGEGYYNNSLVTPDGRWLLTTKYAEGVNLVRINLLTNKEIPVKNPGDFPVAEPVAFIPSLNKVLIFSGYGEEEGEGAENVNAEREGNYYLLEAATGIMSPVKGEFRPLAQQTFRPLQAAANPDEFWAAIPNSAKNTTTVGIYNAKTFTLKPLMKIPKITFDSMAMWADDAEKKIYFVYEGHLLALPFPK